MIAKAWRIARESGASTLLRRASAFLYRQGIRTWLPHSEPVAYAGLPIALYRKWGDRIVPASWLPSATADIEGYEASLVSALRRYVLPGDRVVVVGGGVGVTATIAALQTGADGHVLCYEGAAEGVVKVRSTARINGMTDRLTVEHAVVARAISVYGTAPLGPVVAPGQLPACDVLELDCEGAEVQILREMTIRPRVILVETHGLYGAPTALVTSILEEMQYRTKMVGIAETRHSVFCEANDIYVVAALRADALKTP